MSTLAYVFTGLHRDPKCTVCSGTGICHDCGLLPEGTDCGYCGRSTPRYACEACWPTPCDVCGTNPAGECPSCKRNSQAVTRVGPVVWEHESPEAGACRDCGDMGYTTGCGECGRVTAQADMSLVACQGCGAVWTTGVGNGPVDATEATEWWLSKRCPNCGGA